MSNRESKLIIQPSIKHLIVFSVKSMFNHPLTLKIVPMILIDLTQWFSNDETARLQHRTRHCVNCKKAHHRYHFVPILHATGVAYFNILATFDKASSMK